MSEYFPKLNSLGANIKVELKNVTGADRSSIAKKLI